MEHNLFLSQYKYCTICKNFISVTNKKNGNKLSDLKIVLEDETQKVNGEALLISKHVCKPIVFQSSALFFSILGTSKQMILFKSPFTVRVDLGFEWSVIVKAS